MRWVVVGVAGLALLAACTSTPAPPRGPARPAADRATARATTDEPRGCGGTVLQRGHVPAWTRTAHPPTSLRYAVSDQRNLAGFLFADPLYAGRLPPDVASDKVLWVARYPRNGHPLEVTISKAGTSREPHWEFPADSSPGEIYPSGVHAPSPGCWHVVAEWGSHRATLDLRFVSAD